MKRIVDFLGNAEKFIEDLILVLLSIFVIILSVSALAVLSTVPPIDKAGQIASIVANLSFLGRAEYFVALVLPWVLMIIGLLVARELWMIRKTMQGMHLESILKRISEKTPEKKAMEKSAGKIVKKRK